ncbi:hypothetical protein [Pantoea sp. SJZ147]|uniref:hypothetical protein n=1 Tax=Pantoea sp. SJZ147 TaxID=2572896 RepID=UPI0011A49C9A|nr:hypothetical protein [Pantoea sp. SJZ147]TWD44041.1 hypothetical protein FBY13_102180 [Pantoea sp. SJZ147]
MKFFLNELSLTGQFNSSESFIIHFKDIISLKERYINFFKIFYFPRGLPELKVSGEKSFREAVNSTGDRDFIRKVILWLDRQGPFIEPDSFELEGDFIYEMDGNDISGTSLAYATDLAYFNSMVKTYSFDSATPSYSHSPLKISYFFNDEISNVEIENFWDLTALECIAKQYEVDDACLGSYPDSWDKFLQYVAENYSYVKFSDDVKGVLKKHPFNSIACERGIFLTSILNEYVASRNEDGSYSEKTNGILKTYFTGGRALFTDESASNKEQFCKEMTFVLDGEDVLCSWHGKISYRVFRMHFNYPLKHQDKSINVLYFGPKITKK